MSTKYFLVFIAWLMSIGLVIGNPVTAQILKFDHCEIGLNDTLDGRAYTVEPLSDDDAKKVKLDYENYLKLDEFVTKFTETFGNIGNDPADLLKNLEWYYRFDTVRSVHLDDILDDSFQCIFVTDREYKVPFAYAFKIPFFVANYAVYRGLSHLKTEEPSHAPMPKINFTDRESKYLTCNFARAKTASTDSEYYFGVCFRFLDNDLAMVLSMTEEKGSDRMFYDLRTIPV